MTEAYISVISRWNVGGIVGDRDAVLSVLQAVQGRLLGLADLTAERLCAIVKHEAREEYA